MAFRTETNRTPSAHRPGDALREALQTSLIALLGIAFFLLTAWLMA